MDKTADTKYSILEALAERWSPRAFSDQPVEREKIQCLFEAARWAASSFNEQPWRFILATRDEPAEFERALSCLVEGNQSWCKSVPLLVLALTKTSFTKNDKPNRVHLHDLGLAMGNLSVQATAMGLSLHQMAGIVPARVRQAYEVPEGYEPQTAIAIGYIGDPEDLPEPWMQESERADRTRMDFAEFVFAGKFGKAAEGF